ncbi:MAG: alpha/beta fold hydrolase [Thermoproteota archaeon]|nr:alpha/beta fold hydrolase [Thermoproteota archaeon]
MSYENKKNESAWSLHREGDPFFRVIAETANLISEYTHFYYSSISKLISNSSTNLPKQTEEGRKEEINNDDAITGLDTHFFNDWIKITNIESNNQFKSQQFLQSLNEYVDGLSQSFRFMTGSTNNSNNPYLEPVYSFNIETRRYLSALSETQSSFHETPYRVIGRWEDTRLLHYTEELPASNVSRHDSTTTTNTKYLIPLLIVYAPINRYHIMDLNRGRSIVEKFVSAGFDVFLLDWGLQTNNRPSISDYIDYIGKAVETICSMTRSNKVNLLGYSWGGTLSVMYAAGRSGKDRIQNLIVQSSNIDFSRDNSILAQWVRSLPVQKFVEQFGIIDCHLINIAFIMRNPAVRIFDDILFAIKMGQPEKFVENLNRIITWLSIDVPYLPGLFYYQFARYLYRQNLLIQNKMQLPKDTSSNNAQSRKINREEEQGEDEREEILKLSTINVPLLNIVGDKDDLTPPASSIPLNDIVSSKDKQLLRFPAGHVELCIGAAAHEKLWPQAVEWLGKRSEKKRDH